MRQLWNGFAAKTPVNLKGTTWSYGAMPGTRTPGDAFRVGNDMYVALTATEGMKTGFGVVADSHTDWTTTGAPGENGWSNGYYDLTNDPESGYADADFRPFPTDGTTTPSAANYWNGSNYDWFAGNPPWTYMDSRGTHPNGTNNGVEHWSVRRYEAPSTGVFQVQWNLSSQNSSGTGTTGLLFRNGVELDKATIAGNDRNGVTRDVTVLLSAGDRLDLALSPEGLADDRTDGADSSNIGMQLRPVNLLKVADSVADWSATGAQGENNWTYGYHDATANGAYDAGDFQAFAHGTPGQNEFIWTGSAYDWGNGNPPWTSLAQQDVHPNVDGVEHWLVRRYESERNGTLYVDWHMRKTNTGGGDGVSGHIYHNGVQLDTASILGNDNTGVTRRVAIPNVRAGDLIDVTLAPNADQGHDGSIINATVHVPLLADSVLDWSADGTQGERGWYNGIYNLTQDSDGTYQSDDFEQFAPSTWVGSGYDAAPSAPWTNLFQEGTHPNGANSTPGDEHWTMRRWEAEVSETTPVMITWKTRKTDLNGDGATGLLFINGQQVDVATVAGADGTGVTRTVYANIEPGDKIDLALSPEGLIDRADGNDGSANRLTIDPNLPEGPYYNPVVTLATTRIEFSGNQGQDGWHYGYYDRTADIVIFGGDEEFQADEFVDSTSGADPAWQWNGSAWDWVTGGNPPWTEVTATSMHPNGTNHPPTQPNDAADHVAMRRWVFDEDSDATALGLEPGEAVLVRISGFFENPSAAGDGTIGKVFMSDGPDSTAAPIEVAAVFTNGYRDYFEALVEIGPGFVLDFGIDPGLAADDGSDGTAYRFAIEVVTPFTPVPEPSSLALVLCALMGLAAVSRRKA